MNVIIKNFKKVIKEIYMMAIIKNLFIQLQSFSEIC